MIPLPLFLAMLALFFVLLEILHSRVERRKESERELKQMLMDSTRELASLEMLKTDFLARISDVLSEPLKAIETSSLRIKSLDSKLPEDVRAAVAQLTDELHSLIKILEALEDTPNKELHSSQETGETIQLPAVQLDDIVSDISMDMCDPAADKSVSLSVAVCENATVSGNENQLRDAIVSLFEESLRRADTDSVMNIELKSDKNVELRIDWESQKKDSETAFPQLTIGFVRLVASSHGGWLNADIENGHVSLVLPLAGEGK